MRATFNRENLLAALDAPSRAVHRRSLPILTAVRLSADSTPSRGFDPGRH